MAPASTETACMGCLPVCGKMREQHVGGFVREQGDRACRRHCVGSGARGSGQRLHGLWESSMREHEPNDCTARVTSGCHAHCWRLTSGFPLPFIVL